MSTETAKSGSIQTPEEAIRRARELGTAFAFNLIRRSIEKGVSHREEILTTERVDACVDLAIADLKQQILETTKEGLLGAVPSGSLQ